MKTTSTLTFIATLLLVLLYHPDGIAQVKKTVIQKHIQAEEYSKALDALAVSGLEQSDSCFFNYVSGLCRLQIGIAIPEAVTNLKRATQCFPLEHPLDNEAATVWFFYGQALHANYQFAEAIDVFNSLKSRLDPKSSAQISAVDNELSVCATAIKLMENPVEFTITNLGKALNTTFNEHSPVVDINENQIIFTSNRKNSRIAEGLEGLYYSLWREGKWLPAKRISGDLAQYDNTASVSISSDGKTLLLYAYNGKSGDLYYSLNKKGRWETPVKYPAPINSSHNETHASLSTDEQTIYFTSDRPGGYGGKDIYLSRKLPTGEWGPAQNLGPIVNTASDEESPFIMADGRTLYFASEGHENMGGFDIFKTQTDGLGSWSVPTNIGYPVNTPGDDIFYCPTADGLRVYFASTREGTTGNADIFLIEYPSETEERQAVVSGFVYHGNNIPAGDAIITVENAANQEVLGYYKPNPANGKYLLVLSTGVRYNITISETGCEDVQISYSVPLKGEYAARGTVHYINPVVLKAVAD